MIFMSDKVKIIAESSIFVVGHMSFYFLHAKIYALSTQIENIENNNWSPISPLSPRTVFSDLPLWCHHIE